MPVALARAGTTPRPGGGGRRGCSDFGGAKRSRDRWTLPSRRSLYPIRVRHAASASRTTLPLQPASQRPNRRRSSGDFFRPAAMQATAHKTGNVETSACMSPVPRGCTTEMRCRNGPPHRSVPNPLGTPHTGHTQPVLTYKHTARQHAHTDALAHARAKEQATHSDSGRVSRAHGRGRRRADHRRTGSMECNTLQHGMQHVATLQQGG